MQTMEDLAQSGKVKEVCLLLRLVYRIVTECGTYFGFHRRAFSYTLISRAVYSRPYGDALQHINS